jgi:hypothetical protein
MFFFLNLALAFQKQNAHPQRQKVPPFSKGVIMHGSEPSQYYTGKFWPGSCSGPN